LTLAACGGGDGEKSDGEDSVAPTDTVQSDAVLSDVAPEEDNAVTVDIPTVEEITPPPVCEPACDIDNGEYCAEDSTCQLAVCAYCLRDSECDEGESCFQFKFASGDSGSFCTTECTDSGDCSEGRVCGGDPKHCIPQAACAVDNCGDGAAGEPCSFDGNVNEDCGECQADLTCYGIAPSGAPCESDKDCVLAGHGASLNPDCVDGFCSESYCIAQCVDYTCDVGFEAVSVGIGNCLCLPGEVGAGEAGDACPIWNVHYEEDYCGPDLRCLGVPAQEDEDDPLEGACETTADCEGYFELSSPTDCVDGYCGTSFCSPECNESAECETGYQEYNLDGTCFCLLVPSGDGMPGDACPYGLSNVDADLCDSALRCLGQSADETVPCLDASDCANPPYSANPVCVEGWCGTSFCSEKCGADDTCDEGFEPVPYESFGIDKCTCVPEVPTGSATAGEACPVFNVNTDADYCSEDLECVGDLAAEGAETCDTANDCTQGALLAEPVCTLGFCASSACYAICEAGATLCGEGAAYFYGECICDIDFLVGDGKEGEACPYFTVNTDAETCEDDLVCGGIAVTSDGAECETADDCDAEDFPGVIECVDGFCGSSFCVAQCTDGECAEDFDTLDTEAGLCFCVPAS